MTIASLIRHRKITNHNNGEDGINGAGTLIPLDMQIHFSHDAYQYIDLGLAV